MKCCVAVLMVVLATMAHAQPLPPGAMAVSSGNLSLDISAGETSGVVRVFNLSDEPLDVVARVNHFDLDENNEVRVIAPTPQSLDQWLIINPLNFTIPPGGQQVVRFAVRPRVEPEPGEHRAMVFFERKQPEDDTSLVRVLVRMGVAVYANVAPIRRDGRLLDAAVNVSDGGAQLSLRIESAGNALVRLNGRFAIWPTAQYPGDQVMDTLADPGTAEVPGDPLVVGRLPGSPVLAGTTRDLRLALPEGLEAGADYTLAFQADLAGQDLRQRLTFSPR